MSMSNLKSNCLSLSTTLNHWFEPLFATSPINSVTLERYHHAGELEICSSHVRSLDYYLTYKIHDAFYDGWDIDQYYDGYFVEASLKRNIIAQEYNTYLEKKFGLNNVFFICKRKDTYTDFYILTTNERAGLNFYFNNLVFLEKITHLFARRLENEKKEKDFYKYKINECKVKYSPFSNEPDFSHFDIIQKWKFQANEAINHHPLNALTPREIDCVKLLLKGYTAKEIGRYFGISSRTVETHCKNIKAKLHVRSKKEIIQYFD